MRISRYKLLPALGVGLGAASLICGFIALVMPLNEYRARGIDAFDCDGPMGVGIMATVALLLGCASLVPAFASRAMAPRLTTIVVSEFVTVLAMVAFMFPSWQAERRLNETPPSPCIEVVGTIRGR